MPPKIPMLVMRPSASFTPASLATSRSSSSHGSPFTTPLIVRSTRSASSSRSRSVCPFMRLSACPIAAWRGRHTYSAFIADSALCPLRIRLRARAIHCRSLFTAHSTSVGSTSSPRRPSRIRSARAVWPRIAASPSCSTSKRALSATASTTVSAVIGPGGNSSASFSISWCAASRLPSTRSASSDAAAASACSL